MCILVWHQDLCTYWQVPTCKVSDVEYDHNTIIPCVGFDTNLYLNRIISIDTFANAVYFCLLATQVVKVDGVKRMFIS